jgi:hypothetical protein
MNERSQKSPKDRPERFPRIVPVLGALIAGVVIVQLAVTYLIDTTSWRLWGVNYPAFFKENIPMLVLALLPIVGLLPPVLRRLSFEEKKARRQSGTRDKGHIGSVLTWLSSYGIVLAVVLLLPVGYAFLGDGAFYMSELYRMVMLPNYHPSMLHLTSALTGYAVVALTWIFKPEYLYLPYQIIGALSALFLVSMFLFFRRKMPRDTFWLAVAVFAGGAGSLMLFRYVEMYALQYVFLIGFFLSSWGFLKGVSGIRLPTMFLALAVATGFSAIAYLPAWIFLLAVWKGKTRPSMPLPRASMLLMVCLVIAIPVAYLVLGPGNGYLMPLTAGPMASDGTGFGVSRYTLLCGAHIADVFNLAVLHAIGPLCLIAAVLIVRRRVLAWRAPMMLFALIALCTGLLGILFGHAMFGLARDWDLAAIFTLPFAFLAMTFATEHLESRARGYIVPIIMLFQLSTLGSWVLLNHDGPASARRLYSLVSMNMGTVLPATSFSGLENLRKFYSVQADGGMHARLLEDMWATGMDAHNVLTKQLSIAMSEQDAITCLEKLRVIVEELRVRLSRGLPARFPTEQERSRCIDFLTRTILVADKMGYHEYADSAATGLVRDLPEWKGFRMLRAIKNSGLSPEEQAGEAEQSITRDCQDPALLRQIGTMRRAAGQFGSAAITYRRAIEVDDASFSSIYLALAVLYNDDMNDRDSAVVWLKRCVERCGNTEAGHKAMGILQNWNIRQIPK